MLVFSSILIMQKSKVVMNVRDDIYFGYPVGFLRQDFNGYDSVNYYQSFSLKRENAETKFLWGRFAVSSVSVFVILSLLIYVLEIIDFQIRKLISKTIIKYKNRKIRK